MTTFAALPADPATHFRLLALGTILAMAEASSGNTLQSLIFIEEYRTAAAALAASSAAPSAADWTVATSRWSAPHTALPANRLLVAGFTQTHLNLLMTLAIIEEDLRLIQLIEPDAAPPTLGGLVALWRTATGTDDPVGIRTALTDLADAGFLHIANPDAPRTAWQIRAPIAIVEALAGTRPRLQGVVFTALSDLPDPASWIGDPVQCAPFLVVRGPHHNGRKTVLKMAARSGGFAVLAGTQAVFTDPANWRLAGAVAVLSGAMILLDITVTPGETLTIPTHPAWRGPLAIATGPLGSIHTETPMPRRDILLRLPSQASRVTHWQKEGITPPPDIASMAITTGNIHRAAAATASHAAPDLRQAIRSLRDSRLDALAAPIDVDTLPEPLFLDSHGEAEFAALLLRCRHRESLAPMARNRGVRALFSGPSGTGKTLAARHIANRLGKDLFRIDLAATVNKYIGETEKCLDRALSAAEELDIVLLLDEGDALMARRTDVGNANDRYANLETNFLLQRIESFDGIILITTNDADRIDTAFARRMDTILAFRAPDEVRRLDILARQLGDHRATPALLSDIACRCALNGGQLRNIALHARLLALDAGCRPGDTQLRAAVFREYRKTDSHCPLKPPRPSLAASG